MSPVVVSKIFVHPIKSCKGISVQHARYTPEGIQYDRLWSIVEDRDEYTVITAREFPKMVLITSEIIEDDNGGVLSVSFPPDSGCDTFAVALNPSNDLLSTWKRIPTVLFNRPPFDAYICESTSGASRSPSAILSAYFGRPVHLVYKGAQLPPCEPTATHPDLDARMVYQDCFPLMVLSAESTSRIEEELRDGGHVGKQGVEERWATEKLVIERFRPNIVFQGAGPFAEDNWEEIRIGDAPPVRLVSPCTRCLLPNVAPETGIRDKAVPYKIIMKFRTGLDPLKMRAPCVGMNGVPSAAGIPASKRLGRPPHDMARWPFGNGPQQSAPDTTQPAPPPVSSPDNKRFGLENFGNTCYANSVIQALYFCAPFRDLLIQAPDTSLAGEQVPQPPSPAVPPTRRKPERKPSTTNANDIVVHPPVPGIPPHPPSLFSALRSLFVYISTNPAEKGTVAPRAFIDKLKEFNELFRSTMHQDAHEFLNYLLNKIVEEIEEERKAAAESGTTTPSGDDSLPALKFPPPIQSGAATQNPTLVHKLFEGILTSETRCLTCENVSSRDESFLDLSIDIEQNASVTACLRQFSASEMLCQKNKFFCDVCCDLQEAEKRMKIKKLPNVLALHLKRFKYQEDVQKYIKLAYRVAFPFELRLFNTVDDIDDADRLFSLFGIVVHIGNGPHHGHYISIIKTMGSWLVFDDDTVSSITEADIPKYFGESNSGAAYVLYYQAVDIDLPALGLRPPVSPTAHVTELEPVMVIAPGSPAPANPPLPPGLVEEPDTSDTSDSVVPVTPPTPSEPRLHIDVVASSLAEEHQAIQHSIGKKGSNFFGMRRTPSTSARANGSDGRHSFQSNGAASTLTLDDDSKPLLPPAALAPPVPPLPQSIAASNGKDKEKEKAKKEEKEKKGWFGKRRSLKGLDKRRSGLVEEAPPASPVLSSRTPETVSQTSSGSTWFLSSGPSQEKRRPSESAVLDALSTSEKTVSPAKTRPKSTGGGLVVRSEREDRVNGYDSHSGSASSSFVSVGASTGPQLVEFPPARVSSLSHAPQPPPPPPELPTPAPLTLPTKKSLTNLSSPKKSKGPPTAVPQPRPSTANAVTDSASHPVLSRPLPPVPSLRDPLPPPPPPIPPLPFDGVISSRISFDKSKLRLDGIANGRGEYEDESRAELPVPTSPTLSATGSPIGLDTLAAGNHSASSNGSGSAVSGSSTSSPRRPVRKLSLSAPFLGLGGKKKEEKDKEKSPSSFRFGK
ncbi:cysteinease [Mycena kentingensis (nom. inval.)]|nr:cysteinease [Mycena kentingensis (nom. inval.)]